MEETMEIHTTPRGRCRLWTDGTWWRAAAGIDSDSTFYAQFSTYSCAIQWISA